MLAPGIMSVSRLSIVIPVLGKLKKLEDTLVSVLTNRPADCEIVVVLTAPYDDPYELAGEVSFVQAPVRANLVESLNFGIAACRGAIVHTLGCGIEVAPGWTDPVLPHFERLDVAAVAPWIIDRTDPERTLSAGVGYRRGGAAWRLGYRRAFGSPPSPLPDYFGPDLIAGFYRKSALKAAGEICKEFFGPLAGADLAVALHFADRRCVVEPNCRLIADRADLPEGERLGSGREAERLFWRWARRMDWGRAVAGHAGLLVNECLESIVRPTTLPRIIGRAWEAMKVPFRIRSEVEPAMSGNAREHVIAHPHFAQALERNRSRGVGKAS